MSYGNRYKAEKLDCSSRRSIAIQFGDSGRAPIEPDDQQVVVNYFYHDDQFWRAVVPLDGVAEVRGQAFNFSKVKTKRGENGPEIVLGEDGLPRRSIPILNHLQTRFVLKPGHFIELYEMDSHTTGEPTHRVTDFVYSVEAVGPAGITFNLRDALSGSLTSAHRFFSTVQMVFERVVVEGQYVMESPPLPIREQEKRALLEGSLLRSHRAGTDERYYLYRFLRTNNCTSNPFQILDKVVKYKFIQRIGSCLYRLPLNPRFYLRVRGLDANPHVRKQVRTEFQEFIQDPKTKRRKRDYVRKKLSAVRAARAVRKQGASTDRH